MAWRNLVVVVLFLQFISIQFSLGAEPQSPAEELTETVQSLNLELDWINSGRGEVGATEILQYRLQYNRTFKKGETQVLGYADVTLEGDQIRSYEISIVRGAPEEQEGSSYGGLVLKRVESESRETDGRASLVKNYLALQVKGDANYTASPGVNFLTQFGVELVLLGSYKHNVSLLNPGQGNLSNYQDSDNVNLIFSNIASIMVNFEIAQKIGMTLPDQNGEIYVDARAFIDDAGFMFDVSKERKASLGLGYQSPKSSSNWMYGFSVTRAYSHLERRISLDQSVASPGQACQDIGMTATQTVDLGNNPLFQCKETINRTDWVISLNTGVTF